MWPHYADDSNILVKEKYSGDESLSDKGMKKSTDDKVSLGQYTINLIF